MSLRHVFFLGGRDLEMLEIGRLVRAAAGPEAVVDLALPWHGARASAYERPIVECMAAGYCPVLVELEPDLPDAILSHCIVVDHHGDRAGAAKPASIEQVFGLLGLPAEHWTRRLQLVASNDRGWIPELRAIGATDAEIAAIRAEDRSAQGLTAVEESEAEAALAERQQLLGGSLLLVRLPHDRTAAVFDRLALAAGTAPPPDTLITGRRELNFSGAGRRVQALAAAFPRGWCGGALPDRGFWGQTVPLPPIDSVVQVIAGA